MVKLIGALLIMSSLLSLIAGSLIDLEYSSTAQITGNAVSTTAATQITTTQTQAPMGFFDYAEAAAFSYSIASLIMGLMFLFRV